MSKKINATQKLTQEEARIRKFAKYILIAFCMQFVFYLILINFIPLGNDDNNNGYIEISEVNGLYREKWDGEGSYQLDNGRIYIDNGMQFIYGYNMVLLVATLILSGYYMLVYMDKHER